MDYSKLTKEDVANMAYGRIYKGWTKNLLKGLGGSLFFTSIGALFYHQTLWLGTLFFITGLCWFSYYVWELLKLSIAKEKLTKDLLSQWEKARHATS